MDNIKNAISSVSHISVLTGAGVSTDSGIPDFYSVDDTWTYEVSREEATSLDFFLSDPEQFWIIYRDRFENRRGFSPNSFHRFLAGLEKDKTVSVITQNVDGFHREAGSSDVIEIHGSMTHLVDIETGEKFSASDYTDMDVPLSPVGNLLKPDVVLFGERPHGFEEAQNNISSSELLMVAGASLRVSPVNLLPFTAQEKGIPTLWLGRTAPPPLYDFTYKYRGELSEFVEAMGTER